MAKDKMNVLTVASEAFPFAQVGGLADVVGALGKELNNQNVDSRVAIPKYSTVYDYMSKHNLLASRTMDITVPMEQGEIKAKTEEILFEGVIYYFIDYPHYFRRDEIYVDVRTKTDWSDSLERFTFFCKAVLETAKVYEFKPDIIQAHDWQAGLVPIYLKTLYKPDSFFSKTKSIFSIHNLSYQGIFPVEQFILTGLDWRYFTVAGLEYYGHLNLMKGGIVYADVITTVSETYAQEIQTPEYGNGLEGVIREKALQNKLFGIVNGVDYKEWNPAVDVYIQKKYNLKYDQSSLQNKKKIKERFLRDNGVSNPDLSYPLIGVVSRLVDQKGFDLIFEIIDDLLREGVYLTVLGTGKSDYENKLLSIQEKHKGNISVFVGFDVPTAHYIEAASDIFLMPSRFEPCGLNQLYSMRYGTLTVARKTGGLADTVKIDKTGFLFNDYDPDEFLKTLKTAIQMFRNEPESWSQMMKSAMNENWSWDRSAQKYIELFNSVLSI